MTESNIDPGLQATAAATPELAPPEPGATERRTIPSGPPKSPDRSLYGAADAPRAPQAIALRRASPANRAGGWLIVLLLLVGIVAGHDLLVKASLLDGKAWLARAAEFFHGRVSDPWLIVPAVLIGIIGLWFVLAALRPRPKWGLATAEGRSWISESSVGALASGASEGVSGVTSARTRVNRKSVLVDAVVGADSVGGPGKNSEAVKEQIREAVGERLDGLSPLPSVRVRLRERRN